MSEIKLGNKVKDVATGFTGIVTSKIEYLTGCIQFGVVPKAKKDGTVPDTIYLDEKRLVVIEQGIAVKTKRTGGVMHDAPKGSNR